MDNLNKTDPKIADLITKERERQEKTLMLIPSENYASRAVEEAVGSSLGNKYAEGYPKKRYYQGQAYVDQVEQLAIDRAKEAFQVPQVNVQPYSGSPANTAVYFGLLKPGETIMGLTLSHGGHLTHGHPKITFSGRFYHSVQYEVEASGVIDYERLLEQARRVKPALIVAGTTAYPRTLDFAAFSEIAAEVEALLLADISHIAGLVKAGAHPSPVPHAHVVTTTTHKTLRGPRGAMIMVTDKGLSRDKDMASKIDKAVFPGLQGGPHLNTIAGIGVALGEALKPEFKDYGKAVVGNAKALSETLAGHGIELTTGGTDNHLMVADLRNLKKSGKEAAVQLEEAGMVVNYNTVPFDPNPPFNPSGIRLGTPAVTSRGMGVKEMEQIGQLIADVLKERIEVSSAKKEVEAMCAKFPIPLKY